MNPLADGIRVAGLTGNLVPYHHVRWQAFAQAHPGSCFLLELTDRDEFAVLEFSGTEPAKYKRITLFPRNAAASLTAENISRRVAGELDSLRPECVCLNGYASPLALAALDWCLRRGVPAVVMSESTAWDEPRQGWKEWIKSRVIRLCSSALVGGTPHADYMALLGLPCERIFVGYDAVDNDYFGKGAESMRSQLPEIRSKYELPDSYFLASARFTPKKNLPRLVEAFAQYRALAAPQASPWDLVIIGDGAGRDELLAVRARLGLEGKVHLPGAKPYGDLPAYYGLASAFIHASTTEQWGLVVNEAMASGLPVLASNRCGCAPDLVKEGVNGFTFDPYSVEDIAQKMLQLSTSDAQLSAFGRASEKIMAEWSPQKFAGGLSQAIEVALSSPPPRSTWLNRALLWILIHR
jgi:glycosyltransferase involved in cell wall biosynthesis